MHVYRTADGGIDFFFTQTYGTQLIRCFTQLTVNFLNNSVLIEIIYKIRLNSNARHPLASSAMRAEVAALSFRF